MKATIEFWNFEGRKVCIKNKTFNDEKHMDNFIAYMARTKKWVCDEVFIEDAQ